MKHSVDKVWGPDSDLMQAKFAITIGLSTYPWLYFKVGSMGVLLLQRVNIGDLTTCRGKFFAELSVHLLHVPGVFPGLPERPLDFLHPISQLLVALLQRCHFLLQLLHSVLLLKQGFLDRGAHELRGQQKRNSNWWALYKNLLKQGLIQAFLETPHSSSKVECFFWKFYSFFIPFLVKSSLSLLYSGKTWN